jgi:hypothetical protein
MSKRNADKLVKGVYAIQIRRIRERWISRAVCVNMFSADS